MHWLWLNTIYCDHTGACFDFFLALSRVSFRSSIDRNRFQCLCDDLLVRVLIWFTPRCKSQPSTMSWSRAFTRTENWSPSCLSRSRMSKPFKVNFSCSCRNIPLQIIVSKAQCRWGSQSFCSCSCLLSLELLMKIAVPGWYKGNYKQTGREWTGTTVATGTTNAGPQFRTCYRERTQASNISCSSCRVTQQRDVWQLWVVAGILFAYPEDTFDWRHY